MLFSTSAPYGAHLVALLVARLTRTPWVADFRDEWSANPGLQGQPRALNALAGRAERAIAARAATVVVAADYFEIDGLPAEDPRRVEIVNGADEADLAAAAGSSPPADRFVLAHVGTIYGEQDPTPVLEGARGASCPAARSTAGGWRFGSSARSGTRGSSPRPGSTWSRSATSSTERPLPRWLVRQLCCFTFRARALRRRGSCSSTSPRAGRCSASRGPTTWPAASSRSGTPVWPPSRATRPAIERAILALWQRWQADGLPDQAEVRRRTLERYSRRAAAERLAQVLDEACGA